MRISDWSSDVCSSDRFPVRFRNAADRRRVPVSVLDYRPYRDSSAQRLDRLKRSKTMPRAKKIEGNLDAIAARRAELEAELARVTEAERRAREAERDAGRDVLLAALGKVKIARMERSEATAIAKAIEKDGGKRIGEKVAKAGGEEG